MWRLIRVNRREKKNACITYGQSARHDRCISALISAAGFAGADAIIKIDGSSTMYPITDAVAKNFQTTQKDTIKVTVGVSGTGGGFMKFCRGEIDIVNASRPIQGKEMKACNKASVEYVELPIAFDAITVAVNPKNEWIKTMTVAELKKMWEPAAQGKITKWSQVNPAWPDEAFKLYGAGAIPALLIILRKPSLARRNPSVATLRHPRTTTCWSRASQATRTRWVLSVLDIMWKIRRKSELSP